MFIDLLNDKQKNKYKLTIQLSDSIHYLNQVIHYLNQLIRYLNHIPFLHRAIHYAHYF